MSLRFILGRAGTGKTTYCLDNIREKLKANQEEEGIILLVPEQATFQMEMELVNNPDIQGIMGAQVLSFHRLTWRVLQEAGGGSKVHLDDLGKNMVLKKFLEQRKGELRVFRRASELPGFADTLGRTITELKLYQVSVNQIKAFLDTRQDEQSLLLDKLRDLSLIYNDYEEYLQDTFIDPDDYLNLLAAKAHLSPTVKGADIWIDEFTGFTPQELKVLESLLKTASRVNITLALDPLKLGKEYDLFRTTETTYNQLLQIAQKTGTPVEEPVLLEDFYRFQGAPNIGFLEQGFFEINTSPQKSEEIGDIKVIGAQNHRAEVFWVARQIRQLVSQQSLRYKEIGLLLRDFDNYDLLLETTFADYDIPYFMDRKRTIMHHPLVELIRSSLEVVAEDWSYESIFRYLKTDFANITREEVDLLENYVIAYGIRGNRWYRDKDWDYKKRRHLGVEEDQDQKEIEELNYINSLRRKSTQELRSFTERARTTSSTSNLVEALYSLLLELDIPTKLEKWAQEAEAQGRLEIAGEHSQIWDKIIDLLDQLVETLGEENISLESFIKIIDAGLESLKLGLIPPGLDQVVIGSLGRSRTSQLKVVFVLGVGDGILPARPMTEGILDDLERNLLKEMGLELAPSSRERLFDEQYLIYTALTRAKDKLLLSYPLADSEGKGLRPSMVINRIKSLLPDLIEEVVAVDPPGTDRGDLDYIVHPQKTLGYLGIKLRQAKEGLPISPVWWEVYRWYINYFPEQDILERVIAGLSYNNQIVDINPLLAKKLYGNPFRASISRLEKFNACPFSHFTSYGLALKEREVYGLRIPDLGQFFHSALEGFANKLQESGKDWSQLDKKQCWDLTNRVVEELAPQLQSEILLSTARYRYLTSKFKKTVHRAATTLVEHAKRGKFRPLALEIAFGPNGQLPGLKLTLNDGSIMELAGRIDRLDGCKKDDTYFLRVIDYKSGTTGLSMIEVFYGLKLQLITYLDIALEYAQQLIQGEKVVPAGVLYFHLRNPLISAPGPLDDGEIEASILKELKMQGFVLADVEVFHLQDSETSEGWSPIIPVAIKKEGVKLIQEGKSPEDNQNPLDLFYKESKVATLEQINGLREYIRKLLVKGGEQILAGEVQISPYQLKNSKPCGYCTFQVVCQFDPKVQGNNYRDLKPLKEQDIWEIIKTQGKST